MSTKPTIFVVDDDPDMRRSLECLMGTAGLPIQVFESAEQFLESYRVPQPGCMLLDVRMPGMGGLRLLQHMQTFVAHLPVIVFTGYGEVPMAVQAMKSGAFDFIEKPASHQQILDRVQDALQRVRNALAADRERHARELEQAKIAHLLTKLSHREREVLEQMAVGLSGKTIAEQLGISERTVEKHRESIMYKTGTHSLAELIRLITFHQVYGS